MVAVALKKKQKDKNKKREKEKEKVKKEKEKSDKKASGLEEDKILRVRANKAIALANKMMKKGLIKEDKKEATIEGLMLMDDLSFAMEEQMTTNKESLADAISQNKKGNRMVRKGGLNAGINVIANGDGSNMKSFKSELEGIWNKPKK